MTHEEGQNENTRHTGRRKAHPPLEVFPKDRGCIWIPWRGQPAEIAKLKALVYEVLSIRGRRGTSEYNGWNRLRHQGGIWSDAPDSSHLCFIHQGKVHHVLGGVKGARGIENVLALRGISPGMAGTPKESPTMLQN